MVLKDDKIPQKDLEIKENALTPAIFSSLRPVEQFQVYQAEDIEIALKNTLYSIVIYHKEIPIAMGRIIGDDRITFIIKDVAVSSDYRKKGIGNLIMKYLLNYIQLKGSDCAYIGLMSTLNNEHFYEKFGFKKRPNDKQGHGMVKFLEKRSMS